MIKFLVEILSRIGEILSMDYSQTILNLIEIIILALTLFYAVRIPNIIAKEQNKIALFEKRFEVFRFYEKCNAFSNSLVRSTTLEEIRRSCDFCFGIHCEQTNLNEMLMFLEKLEYNSHQLYFLFPNIIDEDAKSLYLALYNLTLQIVKTDKQPVEKDILVAKNDYILEVKKFKSKYEEIIFKEIKLCGVKL